MKKVLSFVILLLVLCIPTIATDFYDMPRDESEKSQAVYKLADAGIVGGYENGTFRPNNQLTRAELCKIINLIFEFTTSATTNFADVKDTDWFYGHVLVAKQAGYINGFENNTFRGNANLTREQTCAIISRITKLELKSSNVIIKDNVSDWAKNDVLKVISNGIMPLEENGVFRATENITRAELCMALARYVEVKNAEPQHKFYSAEELNKQAKKYVGEIITYDKSSNAISIGTGFVYTEDGRVITNYHVIDGAYSAKIIINGVEYEIKSVLGYDEYIDLAILKINGSNLSYAKISKTEPITGNTVYAIGSSRGLTNTFSKGIITYFDRVIDGVNYIQHDASITNGNSGGPLINEYGEVIGINTWGINDSQNLNFAVSVSELNNISLNKNLTLVQLYNSKITIYGNLSEWVEKNYNGYGNGYITFEINKSAAEIFGITYYQDNNYLAIDYTIKFNNGDHRFVTIYLDNDDSAYYNATYSDIEGNRNSTKGYIVKNTYTASSVLNYTNSEGGVWNQESLMATYQTGVNYLLGFFSDFLKAYYPTISLKDFGYNNFVPVKWSPYQVVEDDFTKLKNYIINNGVYDVETKNYVLYLYSFDHIEETEFYHSVVYDTTTYTIDLISILHDKLLDIDYRLCISMPNFDGVYDYYYIGQHTSDNIRFKKCNMNGSINASTFDYFYTLLPCEYHSFGSSDIVDCRSMVSLLTFSICSFLDSYFSDLGITAKDIGFSNY